MKGSGRSIKELNLHEALTACSSLLSRFGGHHQAAGLTIEPGRLEEFRKAFNGAVVDAIGEDPVQPTLHYDDEAGCAVASNGMYLAELELMQPFGVKNPEPVFISPPLRIRQISLFGAGNAHARLTLCDEAANISLQVKAWRMAKEFPLAGVGRELQIAYSTRLDSYNGIPKVDIHLRDWRWLA